MAQLSLSKDTKTVISLCDQVEGRGAPIYGAFENLPYTLPVAGGLCHENDFGRWVMHNEETYQHACVAVALTNPRLKVWSDAYSEVESYPDEVKSPLKRRQPLICIE
ncbi:hypothetical protein O9929_22330 [Vibrio lentus]|nr:hypothetical protein [Vibrio lentus]